MKRTALTLYRRFCKARAERRGESFLCQVDRARLQEIIGREPARRCVQVDEWLPAGLLDHGVFRYGVNPSCGTAAQPAAGR